MGLFGGSSSSNSTQQQITSPVYAAPKENGVQPIVAGNSNAVTTNTYNTGGGSALQDVHVGDHSSLTMSDYRAVQSSFDYANAVNASGVKLAGNVVASNQTLAQNAIGNIQSLANSIIGKTLDIAQANQTTDQSQQTALIKTLALYAALAAVAFAVFKGRG